MQSSQEPIFIVGCPRSGTTVLASVLNQHSKITVSTETHFFNNLRKSEAFIKALDSDACSLREVFKQERLSDLLRVSKLKLDDLIQDYFLARTDNSLSNQKIFIDLLMQRLAQSQSKIRWCEKTPQHLLHVDEILKFFPDAKIIQVVRDGRDTVNSLMKMPWRPPGLLNNSRFWLKYIDAGVKLDRDLAKTTMVTVKYEDLILSPAKTLAEICDFLGESFEAQMLESQDCDQQVFATWENEWKSKATENFDSSRIGAWQKEMSQDDQDLMNFLLAKKLKELDYKVTNSFSLRLLFTSYSEYIRLFFNKIFRRIISG